MTRAQEWDWPPTRRGRYYRTRFDIYHQPAGGWNSPLTKKIIDIYWRVTIAIIKVLLGSLLFVMSFCASWLLCVLLTL